MFPITLKAKKLNQPAGKGRSLYLTTFKVKDLIDARDLRIDLWDKDKKLDTNQGYQRRPTPTRLLRVVKFLEREANPIFPTSILLSSREKLEFRSQNDEEGYIKITHPLWIVDGQHRILGLKLAVERGHLDWKDYELSAVIIDNFDKPEETIQFYILNTEQKRVPTDLAQRLIRKIDFEKVSPISFTPSEEWKIKGLQIIDKLNETDEEKNVWFDAIRLPNTEKKKRHIINQNSFLTSLKPLLAQGILQDKNYEICFKVIKNYWAAIKKIIPEPFNLPQQYVIQKTPGVFSLHDLANRIMLLTNDYTENNFIEILEKVFRDKYGDENFWKSKSDGAAIFNSMKGFKVLANLLAVNLPTGEIQKNIKV